MSQGARPGPPAPAHAGGAEQPGGDAQQPGAEACYIYIYMFSCYIYIYTYIYIYMYRSCNYMLLLYYTGAETCYIIC